MTDCTSNTSVTELALHRRGFDLGSISIDSTTPENDPLSNWGEGKPVYLQGICREQLSSFTQDIKASEKLYSAVLDEQECDEIFTQSPYIDRLETNFESLGSSYNEGDEQEIETVIFDAISPEDPDTVLAEDLWVKASWLSFYEGDASLRFRFSFGVDFVEDVAADQNRQHYAALLTEAVFPESNIITANQKLKSTLSQTLGSEEFRFVERIIYFNSPNGGAYLHHDRERGHAGVVYAQLTGKTLWLALPQQALINEINLFVKTCQASNWPANISTECKNEIINCAVSEQLLANELDSFANSALIHLINETPDFVQQLINNGHSRQLNAGDAMLLPQESALKCCWHSVFCLGEESGQALSFAIRSA